MNTEEQKLAVTHLLLKATTSVGSLNLGGEDKSAEPVCVAMDNLQRYKERMIADI